MLIEKIEQLCKENNTTLTSLCKEITGSSGNLPTWKKGNIKLDWLIQICNKFKISSDTLLDLPSFSPNVSSLALDEFELINTYNELDRRGQHRVHTIIYEELDRINNENAKKGNYDTG